MSSNLDAMLLAISYGLVHDLEDMSAPRYRELDHYNVINAY